VWTWPYYDASNPGAVSDRSSHHLGKVLWHLPCGCYLYKSPHAVSSNIARKEQEGKPPSCFLCPWHSEPRRVSSWTYKAYAELCSILAMRRELGQRCGTVVWEAHAVAGQRAYDLYVYEAKLLIEVDGEGHTDAPMFGVSVAQQRAIDACKDQAARNAGLALLRLSHADRKLWRERMNKALNEAWNRL
jgi:hypothetical protein